ncbi:Glycosyltransferase, catalytic subunit of cellulose synthase and poly-beta-1,6-N-acetylglucosamine synthase [Actinoplanes cyaneus]|nr:Glycosyltransferase, catalytic subunit of cellulose synthase and poly-beta-1,6-N-acetylglucosamine synthase [Actinoplanes cyaneus]
MTVAADLARVSAKPQLPAADRVFVKGPATLGDMLLARGLVTARQMDDALREQEATGSRLGAILITSGAVRRLDLYELLAEQWGLPFLDLTHVDLDPELLDAHDPTDLVRAGWVPVRREADGAVLVATAERPSDERAQLIRAAVGGTITQVVTTDWDIDQAVHRSYRERLVDDATMGLWRRSAAQSARQVLYPRQAWSLGVLLSALAGSLILFPRATLTGVSMVIGVFFLVSVMFKFVVCLRGAKYDKEEAITAEEVAALGDHDLPVYTVLVPVYREANVIGDLLHNLGDLDYPRDRLEILLLMEEDDAETIAAARAAKPPPTVRFVIVPDRLPKTKPKACNVGLFFARGEYVVIYDAEDRPEPDQLKKAVVAFRRAGPETVCIQAALNYWNVDDNALTRMFTLEYSFWFDYMLPGLDDLNLPIPLGGTSNHFRVQALRTLGGWDPFNVTEDADLGIRASVLGYRVGVINSTTYEEANRAVGNWIRQRSRWIKGYMQTLLVHLRRPGTIVRGAGIRQSLSFVLLIGGTPASFLLTPPLYVIFAISLIAPELPIGQFFPTWVMAFGVFNLLVGNTAMVYLAMMGAFRRRRYGLMLWSLLNPVYWLLHAIAAYKALWQLITKPHYWEKTTHGLSVAPGRAALPDPVTAGQPG